MKVPQSIRLCNPIDYTGKNTGVGRLSLLQGIFPIQGSNPGLLCWRQILYQLGHQGSLRILEWVSYPFSKGSSWPRNQTRVSCFAGHSLKTELSGKPYRSLDNIIWNGRDHFTWTYSKASIIHQASLVAQMIKRLHAMQETRAQSLGREDPLEKEMITHSSILAWRIPWRRSLSTIVHGVAKSRTWLSDFTFTSLNKDSFPLNSIKNQPLIFFIYVAAC